MDELLEMSKYLKPEVPRLPSHEYKYEDANGKELVGVTTISGRYPAFLTGWANGLGVGGYDNTAYFYHSGNIGTVAHKMIDDFNKGQAYVRQENWEYFELIECYEKHAQVCYQKYLDFVRAYPDFEILHSEQKMTHEDKGFGGTVDIIAKICGKVVLLDVKTTNDIHTSHRIQVVGGYSLLCEFNDIIIENTMLLKCSRDKDEKYKWEIVPEFDLLSYQRQFLALLDSYNIGRELVAGHKSKEYKAQKKVDKLHFKVG